MPTIQRPSGETSKSVRNRLFESFPQSGPIGPNSVNKAVGSIRTTEEDFAGTKPGLSALHIRDRVGWLSPFKRRQPESRFPFAVFCLHHDLSAVARRCHTSSRLESGCQWRGTSRFQVGHPHFTCFFTKLEFVRSVFVMMR